MLRISTFICSPLSETVFDLGRIISAPALCFGIRAIRESPLRIKIGQGRSPSSTVHYSLFILRLIKVWLKFTAALCFNRIEIRYSVTVAVDIRNVNRIAVLTDAFGDILDRKRLFDTADNNVEIEIAHFFLDGFDFVDYRAIITL